MSLYPLKFENNFKQTVWGGHRIKPFKGLPADDEPVGESWEISDVSGMESVVANGPLRGQTLRQLVDTYGDQLIGATSMRIYGRRFPLLAKFIDAQQDLSIQVHPDDTMAMREHGSLGKTEMWYVMDSQPGARLYTGFNSPISKYEFKKRVEDGSIGEVLREYHVQRGDVFFIPAGRIHAICAGAMVAEIQQSSDVTYRIYDYGRMGLDGRPRQLHVQQAEQALDYTVHPDYQIHYKPKTDSRVLLTECQYFTAKLLMLTQPFHRKLKRCDTFIIYMCLDGECELRVKPQLLTPDAAPHGTITISKGNSCLMPATLADYILTPRTKTCNLLEVFVDNVNFN